jgi:hypothetical protein
MTAINPQTCVMCGWEMRPSYQSDAAVLCLLLFLGTADPCQLNMTGHHRKFIAPYYLRT